MQVAGCGMWMAASSTLLAAMMGSGCGFAGHRSQSGTSCETSQSDGKNGCVAELPDVQRWPDRGRVAVADETGTFGGSLSGLTYEPATSSTPAVLWAVRNTPSTLYRLVFDGDVWQPDSQKSWRGGRELRYVDGRGSPDAESITKAEWLSPFVYVAAERDLGEVGVSRLSVLQYDPNQPGKELTATREWDLTSDLPTPTDANLGLEAITWIPDRTLVAASFVDEGTGQPYDPSAYPDHGSGLFVVGMEGNGILYAYALDHTGGGFRRVATIAGGNAGVMGLEFDRDVGYLWTQCDDSYDGQTTILDIDEDRSSRTFGQFRLRARLARPAGMPNLNNEGIAMVPESECNAGTKRFFWSDDSETNGHALRVGLIPCGPFL